VRSRCGRFGKEDSRMALLRCFISHAIECWRSALRCLLMREARCLRLGQLVNGCPCGGSQDSECRPVRAQLSPSEILATRISTGVGRSGIGANRKMTKFASRSLVRECEPR